MTSIFEPRLDILPAAQRDVWPQLAFARRQSLVLYGGTAVALQLGHRQSVDFDFFCSEPLAKDRIAAAFDWSKLAILQDSPETLVLSISTLSGPVKVSFFGDLHIGRIGTPLETSDRVLVVASREDLLATKLKAILDRAEAKDYRDIAALLRAGASLPVGLAGFRAMFGGEPAQVLRAIAYFGDGDLATLDAEDRETLRMARDHTRDIPDIALRTRSLMPNDV